MKKPNLFILGAPKCGTTALATWLSAHPEVFMSAVKEPHYFTSEYRLTSSLEAYEANFEPAGDAHRWVGEASVWHLYSPTAVPDILSYSPGARFIAMLRNPLQMVPSMHRQQLFNGYEQYHALDRALMANDARLAGVREGVNGSYPPEYLAYLHTCALGWQLERAIGLIPRDRLHVILFDDLKRDPDATFRRVLEFLDLDCEGGVQLRKVNQAKVRRSYALNAAVRLAARAKGWVGMRRRFGMLNRLSAWNKRDLPLPPLDAGVEAWLRRAFAEDVALLGRLLDRDLGHWLG